jgi:glyoxylase-like metal-dependent hydrolase (beta-lactamase superfamily II)
MAEDVRILVDTGGRSERIAILELLVRQSLAPADIAYVVCTHGHIDHVGNANLFERATFISGHDQSRGDHFTTLDLGAGPVLLTTGVEVLATPGHTSEDISLLVRTARGVVAIAGDVFENDDPDDQSWRAFSRDPARQKLSRTELLGLADFIVPGHGAMFATVDFRFSSKVSG